MRSKLIEKLITGFFILIFGNLWLFNARYYEKPKHYSLISYDVFGNQNMIDGLKTTFHTKQVADSFVKEYQNYFPQYNFFLVADFPQKRRRKIFEILKNYK